MNQSHEQTKKKLKTIGITLLSVGGVMFLIGLIDFFSAFGSFRAPTLFFLCMIGLPMVGIGGGITMKAFQREIQQYSADETIPVINNVAPDIAPAITTIADAVREGVQGVEKKPCPYCGEMVEEDDKFCPACGKPLTHACPACGTTVEADDKFCPECGSPLKK